MANIFDQFDAAPSPAPAASANVFDQFDAPAAAPQAAPADAPRTFTLSNIAKGLYDSVVSGATLPRDVYQGKVDPLSDEAIGRSMDLAGIATPMSAGRMVTQAEKSALFANPRSKVAIAAEEKAAQAPTTTISRPSAGEVATAAENVGVPVPRVALMPSYVQKVGAGLSDIPLVGRPLQQSAEQSLTRAQERVGDIALGMGTPSTEVAGTGIQRGIRDFKTSGIREMDSAAYGPINAAMPDAPVFTPSEGIRTLDEINKRLAESNGFLSGEARNIADLLDRSGVSFKGLQDARSRLGMEMDDAFNSAGYNSSASRNLYGALSRDLENFVEQQGGDELLMQWRAANAQAEANRSTLATVRPLANISNENSAFETAFNLAMDQRGSVNKLSQLKRTISQEDWANVGATSLMRMGGMGEGQGGAFSMQKFVTSYDKMNATTRNILFGDSSKAVDDLATSFRALQGIERFKSKSQSANPLAMGAAGGALFTQPFATVMGALTGYAGASWLSKPATVKSLAGYARTYNALIRRPSQGLAAQADQQARRFGVVLVENGTAPAAANDAVRALSDAARTVYQGSTRGAASDEEQRSR